MGKNMCPYAIIFGEKHTYFISHHYKNTENDKIEEVTFLNTKNGSLDPFDYHLKKCAKDVFKTLERSHNHTFWPDVENGLKNEEDVEEDEDLIETQYLNRNNEAVENFIQKSVICYERDTDYAFRQCVHQCNFEQCYQNKNGIDILKSVVCKT